MDKEKKTNRGEKVKESLLDAGAESATNWGINFINENLPKAMDSTVSKIKELITSFSKSNNVKMRDSIRNVIFQGIEIGEENKEHAMIMAMQREGFDAETINRILKISQQYLVTKEDVGVD